LDSESAKHDDDAVTEIHIFATSSTRYSDQENKCDSMLCSVSDLIGPLSVCIVVFVFISDT